jgi:hypothetical protein
MPDLHEGPSILITFEPHLAPSLSRPRSNSATRSIHDRHRFGHQLAATLAPLSSRIPAPSSGQRTIVERR